MPVAAQDLLPYDIAIVGSGPVGLSMAAALTVSLPGLAVALVAPDAAAADPRASAVAPGARQMLEALGVWPVLSGSANPIMRMVLGDAPPDDLTRPALLVLDGSAVPGEPLAHMVPNDALVAALLAAIGDTVTFVRSRVTGFVAEGDAATLTLDDGERLRARLVIAADGGASPLRTLAGIGVFEHAYGQSGVVGTIGHELPHHGAAYQNFRPTGPFASLPLTGNRSSLVWSESSARAEMLCGMAPEAAAREIEAAMGSVLGKVTLETPLKRFPLMLRLARQVTAPQLALIGDAAHVIHPLAGQGLNLGFKDVAALAECLADGMRMGLDAGDSTILAGYARWRRADTGAMALATDGINRLFSNDHPALRAVRDFALSAADGLAPVKAALIDRAAGTDGPRLLRGMRL